MDPLDTKNDDGSHDQLKQHTHLIPPLASGWLARDHQIGIWLCLFIKTILRVESVAPRLFFFHIFDSGVCGGSFLVLFFLVAATRQTTIMYRSERKRRGVLLLKWGRRRERGGTKVRVCGAGAGAWGLCTQDVNSIKSLFIAPHSRSLPRPIMPDCR